jgi:hypothetical protein
MLLLGVGAMAFGVQGLFHSAERTHPGEWAKWFFGALLAHDFVAAPAVFLIGALLAARVPARVRAPIQAALMATGIASLMSWPLLRGYGRDPANASALPNNYAVGLLVVLGVVWTLVVLVLFFRNLGQRGSTRKGRREARRL